MDKYEFKLKVDEMKSLVNERKYDAAAEIAETINWRKIRNLNALVLAGEVFEQVGRYDESKEILLMAYDKSPIGRNIIYRLAEIAIKTGNFEDAQEYYDEFVDIAPHDNLKYVLKYKMTAAQGLPYEDQIHILEELKEQEYSEEWAYELAFLYHKANHPERCVEACDELILWFGDGIYVEKALELKMNYQPLTRSQEEKYRLFRQKRAGVIEVRPDIPITGKIPQTGQMPISGGVPQAGQIPAASKIPQAGQMPISGGVPQAGQFYVQGQESNIISGQMEADGQLYPSGQEAIAPGQQYLAGGQDTAAGSQTGAAGEAYAANPAGMPASGQLYENGNLQADGQENPNGPADLPINSGIDPYNNAPAQDHASNAMEHIKKIVEGFPHFPLPYPYVPVQQDETPVTESRKSLGEILSDWEKTKQAAQETLQSAGNSGLEAENGVVLEQAEHLVERLKELIPQFPAEASQGLQGYGAVQSDIDEASRIIAGMNQLLQSQIDSLLAKGQEQDLQVYVPADPTQELPILTEELLAAQGSAALPQMGSYSSGMDTRIQERAGTGQEIQDRRGMGAGEGFQEIRMESGQGFQSEVQGMEPGHGMQEEPLGMETGIQRVKQAMKAGAGIRQESPKVRTGMQQQVLGMDSAVMGAATGIQPEITGKQQPIGNGMLEEKLQTAGMEMPEVQQANLAGGRPEVQQAATMGQPSPMGMQIPGGRQPNAADIAMPGARQPNQTGAAAAALQRTVPEKPDIETGIERVRQAMRGTRGKAQEQLHPMKEPGQKQASMQPEAKTRAVPASRLDITIDQKAVDRNVDETNNVQIPDEAVSKTAQDVARSDAFYQAANMAYPDNGQSGNKIDPEERPIVERVYPQDSEKEEKIDPQDSPIKEKIDPQDSLIEQRVYPQKGFTEERPYPQDVPAEEQPYPQDIQAEERAFLQDGPIEENKVYPENEREENKIYPQKAPMENRIYPKDGPVEDSPYLQGMENREYPQAEGYRQSPYMETGYRPQESYPESPYPESFQPQGFGPGNGAGYGMQPQMPIEASMPQEQGYGIQEEGSIMEQRQENGPDATQIGPGQAVQDDMEHTHTSLTGKPRFRTQAQVQASMEEFSEADMEAAAQAAGFRPDDTGIKLLTPEQKQVFSYFVPISGMEAQIYDLLEGVSNHLRFDKNSITGNFIVEGISGSGKTVLITDIIKVLQKEWKRPNGKIGRIDASALNQKDLDVLTDKISGGCLIIESAGKIARETAVKLSECMEKDRSGTLYILEDTKQGIQKALNRDSSFAAKFTEKISIPFFTSDELVEFGRAYANDLNYDIDEMGTLALYKRISSIQKLNHVTTLTEVKEIIDEAIDNAEKGALKKVLGILTSTRYNNDNYIILREKDFEQ